MTDKPTPITEDAERELRAGRWPSMAVWPTTFALLAALDEARARADRAERRESNCRKFWLQAARRALAGDQSELRNRVDMAEAPPVEIVLSSAAGQHRERGE